MRGDMTNDGYHYRECGLESIHLLNGFEVKETDYGKVVAIHNLDGLHRAIGTHLVREKKNLSGGGSTSRHERFTPQPAGRQD